MKIGVTGWRGFIGSYLMKKIDNPILFQGDLRKLDSVKGFVRNCDRIYHLAGRNIDKEGNIIANNLLATGNLILATKIEKVSPEIIFASSIQAVSNPNSEYGLTKLSEEGIIKKANRWCIYRVPNVYGVGGKPFYNGVVATFAYQIAHKEKVNINDPNATREFIYIDDLIGYLLKPQFGTCIYPKGEVMSIGKIYEYLTSKLGEHKNLKRCLDYYDDKGGE